MDERSTHDADKMDEVMLPGFRFHPTDEELVGFYLKRKIQQRPLPIELIKQIDIYKYDPWDLPKLATTGEKEWYFYCPRDRKYRNSARPNRVTGAGFWKATGTDRPIYSSEGSKCIGLKKSLVFYKGRAAKGIKTDWMMHEFRLPSLTDSTPQKRFMDKNIPANDSWAICRIFKKTNSTAQRAISHSWVSPIPETTTSDHILTQGSNTTQFSSENMSLATKPSPSIQFGYNNELQQQSSITSFSTLDFPSYKPIFNQIATKPSDQVSISNAHLPTTYTFSPLEKFEPTKYSVDASSMLLNMSSSVFGDFGKASECVDFGGLQEQYNSVSITLPHEMEANAVHGEEIASVKDPNAMHYHDNWGNIRSVGFPINLPSSLSDAWKSNLLWDSSPCPSDQLSTSYSTSKCYT
ncbi:protein FEZ-like [Cornus florida]|uniref:protein FEZ-like n=1 Tax=Cornus florida TaxID=4283 RepID=UPI00289C3510|nr:protein FEZ-like [Cornus florida]